MSFFERYFAALDGADPFSSLEMVAPDVEFVTFWAKDGDRTARQLLGGRQELRAFVEAGGDMSDWAHHITSTGRTGDVEFALGETRSSDGTRIGTFVVVAELDENGLMRRYLAARTPAIEFGP